MRSDRLLLAGLAVAGSPGTLFTAVGTIFIRFSLKANAMFGIFLVLGEDIFGKWTETG
jgi:hypothetical protein